MSPEEWETLQTGVSDLCLRNLSDSRLAGEGCSLAGSSAQSPKAGASLGGGRGEGTEDGGG